ncbi:MAG TPA: hypothetical protein VE781_10700 [Kineosporiaceae bacterium]|nr:hypothetical protein [Kineosporiaceae bacterium]
MAKLDVLGLRQIDERITRFLCATVHLDGTFANYAWVALLAPGRQAQAPEHEIDPIAVARHARLSLGRRKSRDQQLLIVLAAVIGAGVFFVGVGAGGSLTIGQVAVLICALPLVGWLFALLVVFQHYSAVRESALTVFKGTAGFARNAAPPLDLEVEERLLRVHYQNAIIYNSFSPFVGTGHTLDSWRINLYTQPPAGMRVLGAPPPVVFTPTEVQQYLMDVVPSVLNRDAERVRVERRLYVDGGTASNVPGLVPEGQGPTVAVRPRAIVGDDLLDEFTENPTRTARTYCCFVENSGNGDVVVTVMLRAEMVGEALYVEGRSQVLLPVQPGFKDVYWVSPDPGQASLPVLRTALPRTTGLWLESPIRLFKSWTGDRKDARALRDEGYRVERSQPVNFGASSSLREDAALPSDPGFYGAMDQVVYSRVITQQIFESLNDLLASRGVSSPDLEEQRRLLVEQTFNLEGIRNAAPSGTGNNALRR